MKIHRGNDRVVVVLPQLGIVIKFPRIFFGQAMREVRRYGRREGWRGVKKAWSYSIASEASIRFALFGNIVECWREFRFYVTTRHPFLQPTYFSLCGFANIQKYGRLCECKDRDIWLALNAIIGQDIWKNPHHFSNATNFCLENGILRMVDYGNSAVQEVVLTHGYAIMRDFKIPQEKEVQSVTETLDT